MKKHSKRFNKLKELVQKEIYSLDEGISLLKTFAEVGSLKFIESVEAHVCLNIDPKYANQQLRTSLVLPNGTGKLLKIAVFTDIENINQVKKFGPSVVGADDLLEDITNGKFDFDILLTSPQLMPKLTKLGKILGPKGLMPSPKSGTVTQNFQETINEFKKGKLEYRADKTGIVHLNFGKINFSEKQLKENLLTVYNSIDKNKPSGVKGRYLKSFNICTTMSPSINIELSSLRTTKIN